MGPDGSVVYIKVSSGEKLLQVFWLTGCNKKVFILKCTPYSAVLCAFKGISNEVFIERDIFCKFINKLNCPDVKIEPPLIPTQEELAQGTSVEDGARLDVAARHLEFFG